MEREDVGLGDGLTPGRIALIYVLVGGAWILVSDQALAALPVDRALVTQLQTAKGWLFVGLSALLVYGLVARGRRQLYEANRNLTRALQQASVLHRLLRHNLRNACTVIQLETERLADAEANDATPSPARAIERQVETLLELGEKSRHLRQIALDEQSQTTLDLSRVIQATVADFEADHPEVAVAVETPPTARITAYPEMETVIRELLENAVEHAGGDEVPAIEIEVSQTGDRVTLTVADDGPGLPEMEREVLERGLEEPLSHSRGLGLWVVQAIVGDSGGELEVGDREPHGTVVRIALPAAG